MVAMAEPKKKPGRKPSADSKRGQGGDRHTKPRKAFHADACLFEAMERYIRDSRPQPTETQVMITALETFLEQKGYWPPPAG